MRAWWPLILAIASSCVYAEEDPCADLLDTAINAALNDPYAQYNLAVAHWLGECVEQDLSISRVLWRAALNPDLPEAYNNLGFLLYHGHGGEIDRQGAVELWRRGIEVGSLEAQIHLASARLDRQHLAYDEKRAYALASAALQCAERADSQSHVAMASEVLERIGRSFEGSAREEVARLVEKCSG